MPVDIKYDGVRGDHVFASDTAGNPEFTEGADGMAGRALSCEFDGWVAAEPEDVFGNERFSELARGFDTETLRNEGLTYDKRSLDPLVASGSLRDIDGEVLPTPTGEQATRLQAIDVARGSEVSVTTLTSYER